ncbi:hypothetical protein THIOKS190082 [Thiocapsa sp. KS1]|nr:hypothetical protein THIOKS190082 [Thiocapsa sp. KS1]
MSVKRLGQLQRVRHLANRRDACVLSGGDLCLKPLDDTPLLFYRNLRYQNIQQPSQLQMSDCRLRVLVLERAGRRLVTEAIHEEFRVDLACVRSDSMQRLLKIAGLDLALPDRATPWFAAFAHE